MRNTIKLIGIIALTAAIGFAITACDLGDDNWMTVGSTDGSLTINGLSAHEGKWVIASGSFMRGSNFNISNLVMLEAAQSISRQNLRAGARVENGSVTLNLWHDVAVSRLGNFDESFTGYASFSIYVLDRSSLNDRQLDAISGYINFDESRPSWLAYTNRISFPVVTFNNGVGTITWPQ